MWQYYSEWYNRDVQVHNLKNQIAKDKLANPQKFQPWKVSGHTVSKFYNTFIQSKQLYITILSTKRNKSSSASLPNITKLYMESNKSPHSSLPSYFINQRETASTIDLFKSIKTMRNFCIIICFSCGGPISFCLDKVIPPWEINGRTYSNLCSNTDL